MMMQITKPFQYILSGIALLTTFTPIAPTFANTVKAEGDRFTRQGTTLVAEGSQKVVCYALDFSKRPRTNLNSNNVPYEVVQPMRALFTDIVSSHNPIEKIQADCAQANPNRHKVGRQGVFPNFEQFHDRTTEATCSALDLSKGGPRFIKEGGTPSIVIPLTVMNTKYYGHPLSEPEKRAYIATCSDIGDRLYEGQPQGAPPTFVRPYIY
jgi:hypothetical protein